VIVAKEGLKSYYFVMAKVVFTNGIFDLLHPGHIALLKFARAQGDTLIVGINSDRATKLLKGDTRPIHSEQHRKIILENLSCVSQVVIFDDVRPTHVIKELMPDVVVKGAEYPIDDIRRIDEIPEAIEIITYAVVSDDTGEKLSTTALVKKIQDN
jgi:D-beta-D-heptose 7-phosphate kinase / D-beta-D-heptose 1-phosphate adenosyltransferase